MTFALLDIDSVMLGVVRTLCLSVQVAHRRHSPAETPECNKKILYAGQMQQTFTVRGNGAAVIMQAERTHPMLRLHFQLPGIFFPDKVYLLCYVLCVSVLAQSLSSPCRRVGVSLPCRRDHVLLFPTHNRDHLALLVSVSGPACTL